MKRSTRCAAAFPQRKVTAVGTYDGRTYPILAGA
jgi:hypothetical protein